MKDEHISANMLRWMFRWILLFLTGIAGMSIKNTVSIARMESAVEHKVSKDEVRLVVREEIDNLIDL